MARCKKITGYTKNATEIVIPSSIGGQLVRQISAEAFKDAGITKITLDTYSDFIPDGAPWGASGAEITTKDISYIKIPTVSGSFTYDGNEKTPTITDYDSTKMTMSGDSVGTNAGSYTIIFTPKSGYAWTDGTSESKQFSWSIAKAAGTLSVSPNSVELSGSELSKNVTITSNCIGTVNVSSLSGVTTSVSGNTLTITGDGSTAISSGSLTVSVTPDSNHTSPSNVNVSVTASYAPATNYKFYDSNNNELTTITVAGLANAVTYTYNGGNKLPVGGRIFYINPNAVEGTNDKFYVYNNELVDGKKWGKLGTAFNVTTDTIGSGKTNSATCLAATGWEDNSIWTYINTVNTANTGSCNDWYIGSTKEQEELRNSGLVNWFSSNYIWSSSEYLYYPAGRALYWDFVDGYWRDYAKYGTYSCFAVRSF